MATAEAMAAGCVPVVVNKGGQREIVEHGTTGFLWNTLDELKRFTRVLIDDAVLRERMSCAARQRAQRFSRRRFVQQMSWHAGLLARASHDTVASPTGAVVAQ
jgi:glycosyltransferase involved in cell wall biosynthesis